MDINFNFNVRQNVHLSPELKEFIMSQLSDLNAELSATLDAAAQSIKADFDNLMDKVTKGTITDDEVAAFRSNLDRLKTIADPDPSFPPVEPTPEPTPEPAPDQPA